MSLYWLFTLLHTELVLCIDVFLRVFRAIFLLKRTWTSQSRADRRTITQVGQITQRLTSLIIHDSEGQVVVLVLWTLFWDWNHAHQSDLIWLPAVSSKLVEHLDSLSSSEFSLMFRWTPRYLQPAVVRSLMFRLCHQTMNAHDLFLSPSQCLSVESIHQLVLS